MRGGALGWQHTGLCCTCCLKCWTPSCCPQGAVSLSHIPTLCPSRFQQVLTHKACRRLQKQAGATG